MKSSDNDGSIASIGGGSGSAHNRLDAGGTFILYALSCTLCMVAYHKHPRFSVIRHLIIPVFGLLANLVCMGAYVVFPFIGIGTKMEPLAALGIAAVWGLYGGYYFLVSGKSVLVQSRVPAA